MVDAGGVRGGNEASTDGRDGGEQGREYNRCCGVVTDGANQGEEGVAKGFGLV